MEKQTIQRGKSIKLAKVRALNTDINYILLDFKSYLLHDASITWRQEEEEGVGLRHHSLAVVGARAGITPQMSCQSKGCHLRIISIDG